MTQTTVYTGKIWTGVADDDWVEAFAVADGRIIATGALHEVEDQVGTPHETIIIDKGIVTPELIDGHLHLSLGGTQLAHELALDPTDDAETILAKVREWTSRLKPGEWVIGGNIGSGVLPSLNNVEFLERLDAASNGHPLLLRDDTIHNRQINSVALAAMGINSDSPDPDGGTYSAMSKAASPVRCGSLPERLPKAPPRNPTRIRGSGRPLTCEQHSTVSPYLVSPRCRMPPPCSLTLRA